MTPPKIPATAPTVATITDNANTVFLLTPTPSEAFPGA